jgi:hypothetical protein
MARYGERTSPDHLDGREQSLSQAWVSHWRREHSERDLHLMFVATPTRRLGLERESDVRRAS